MTETVPSSSAVTSSSNVSQAKPKIKLQNKPQVNLLADAHNLLPDIDPNTGKVSVFTHPPYFTVHQLSTVQKFLVPSLSGIPEMSLNFKFIFPGPEILDNL